MGDPSVVMLIRSISSRFDQAPWTGRTIYNVCLLNLELEAPPRADEQATQAPEAEWRLPPREVGDDISQRQAELVEQQQNAHGIAGPDVLHVGGPDRHVRA